MLHRLLAHLQGNTVENQLLAITELASLEFKADDTSATYMAWLRGLHSSLQGATIDQFLTLLALSQLDTALYPGTTALFRQGNAALLAESLSQLESRLEKEDRLRQLMGETQDSVRRARAPRPPAASTRDKSTLPYPPSDRQLPFHVIKELTRDTTTCPGCFATNRQGERCREGFCYPLLTAGFLLQHNPDAAAAKILELKDNAQQRKGGRQRGRALRATDKEDDNPPTTPLTPPPAKPPPDEVLGSGKRATSSDPPTTPHPKPTARDTITQSRQNNYADLESDSDDDAGYFLPLEDSNNAKSHSTSYPIAAARRTTVSSTFSTIARQQLGKIKLALRHEDEALCCADSGATRHMFPDYNTFVSYHKCKHKTVKLGDSTELPIMGYGTAKFTLNGHVILVRNALHVPGLTDPLYSLRQHRFMAVDDRVDCLLNFKPIGHAPSKPLEYAEPRTSDPAFDTARPAQLIEPDTDDDTDVSHISYHIPTPKTPATSTLTPYPPTTTSPSTQPPSPISVVELKQLEQSAKTPLSKCLLTAIHPDPTVLRPIPPCYTPGACETRTKFDALKLHKIFGCRRFRSQTHLIAASKNATLLAGGELPSTIVDFASITMPNRGKPITKRRQFLDKVHMDIVFDTGAYPKTFHTDFDQKLIGGAALCHINQHSHVIAAPARRQSSNGLVEATWKTIVRMARAFITEKQVGREFWYFSIRHAVYMLNQVPGRMGRKLTTPFELVYGVKPDSSTWFELFSVGYFDHKTEGSATKSNMEAQTLASIAIGRDDKANTIGFYNPLTKAYNSPPVFKLDEGRLPASHFPNRITFDGGLVCGLQSNSTDPSPEPFPPGTRVNVFINGTTKRGTIQNIPLPSSPALADSAIIHPNGDIEEPTMNLYTVLLDDNTTTELTFQQLLSPADNRPPVDPGAPSTIWAGIPSRYLHQDAKIKLEHDGTYHKGYLNYSPESGFEFIVRRNIRSKKVDFKVPLPNFAHTWTSLLADEKLLFGHTTVSSFLRPGSYHNAPSANHVSAKNLINSCPPSLLKALHPSNPDRHIWLASYKEEKGGLERLDVFEQINKKQYLHLKRSCRIDKALPSMCVLVIKPDKDGNPVRAKSCIVVLGNFEDRYYTKSQRYAPILKYSSLRLLCSKAVGDKCILKQGDCKNAFCHARLPNDELTLVRPPVGDPEYSKDTYWLLNKTLYGLRRSQHHWHNMFVAALKDIGLHPSLHDPCLFFGVVKQQPTSPSISSSSPAPIHVGIYVDDFVFYSTDPKQETLFMDALKQCVVVDFMDYTAHRFAVDRINPTPHMTPYRSGIPIDSIPNPPKAPSHGHYQAALHALKYLYSTADYGISYHSNASHTLQAFNHFPAHHDKEAYTDAIPPCPDDFTRLTSFSYECWGGQFGNAVPDGTPLELFKFRSTSGFVICRSGGPISWKSIRQNRTSLSSCEAEIIATSKCLAELEHIRHRASDLDIPDANDTIPVYNDNAACVQWSASVTNKGTKHMNLRENYVRGAHHLGLVEVRHIPGVINASDLFTKELRDAAHIRRCHDTMMVSCIYFDKYGHVVPPHHQHQGDLPYYDIRSPFTLDSYRIGSSAPAP
eukprot:CCRYP_005776-RA/>CCRYP_005776-RA protein AED:0.13 eAED:0.00 QI:0/0/0/1/1/1/5/0/1584